MAYLCTDASGGSVDDGDGSLSRLSKRDGKVIIYFSAGYTITIDQN